MQLFEDRERAFEAKFAHDEEFQFLVKARRDKLFASSVSGQLRLPDHEAGELTATALAVQDGPGHDSNLLGLAAKVLIAHGHRADTAELMALLEDCGKQAKQQLLAAPLPE